MTPANDEPALYGEAERQVAIAMYIASGDGTDTAETFDSLPDDDRYALMEMARVGMAAHVDWLTDNGFRIAPPGTMLRPKTKDDAQAMIMAAREFLAKGQGRTSSKPKLITGPALILPPRMSPQ
jgi:hypothetical protein